MVTTPAALVASENVHSGGVTNWRPLGLCGTSCRRPCAPDRERHRASLRPSTQLVLLLEMSCASLTYSVWCRARLSPRREPPQLQSSPGVPPVALFTCLVSPELHHESKTVPSQVFSSRQEPHSSLSQITQCSPCESIVK